MLKEQGKNPFIMDSKEPTLDYEEFLNGEIRYNSLLRKSPEEAKALFAQAAEESRYRYRYLRKLAELYAPEADN